MAFPTNTTVVDDFNRANENPVSGGGNWASPIFPGDGSLRVVSNALGDPGGGAWGSSYWNAATYGPDTEVYATLGSNGGNNELMARIQTPNTAGVDNYFVDLSNPTWTIWKTTNNVQTQIGASVSGALTTGDGLGLEVTGSTTTTITAYKRVSGVWTSMISRTDSSSPITSSGKAGLSLNSNTVDNLVIGTISSGTTYTDSRSGALTLAGTGSSTIALDGSRSGALTLAGTGSSTYSGPLSGTGALTLAGSGTSAIEFTASGTGTLTLAGSSSTTYTVAAAASGELTFGGSGFMAGVAALTRRGNRIFFRRR